MKQQDYTTSIVVKATPAEAFRHINNVTHWWTKNLKGKSQQLNDEFTVTFGDVHISTQKLIEVIPDKKVVWLVTDSKINFVDDKQEWTNTKIGFDIIEKKNQTEIHFTHFGLRPEIECFDACTNAWSEYIHESLLPLIEHGKGNPTV